MKIIVNLLLFIITMLCTPGLRAQVQISFQPSIHGNSLDGLTFFRVNNQTNADFNAALRIVITEEKAGKVAEIYTPSLYIKRGLTAFNRSLIGVGSTKFSSNSIAGILRKTGKFPEGEYEYCYELLPLDEKQGISDYYENCFHHDLLPLSPLLLLDPLDEEKICNQKPAFTWQAPMPVDFNAKYRIIVVEKKAGQTAIEALSYNQPVLNVSELREPRLNYPFNVKELEKGKTYAWQIYYSINNILIKRSEIWSFKIDCEEENETRGDGGFRELKPANDGDFYIATGKLKFAFHNPYSDGLLDFSIVNLGDPSGVIKHLPKLKLATGFNKYELDLSDNRAFKDGENYQLEVVLPNGQKLLLRFIYHD